MKKAISFQGGGVLGAAQAGMLYEAFETDPVFSQYRLPRDVWQNVAGTSIGSLNGLLVALGYSAREIYEIWFHAKLNNFVKKRWNFFKSVYSREPMVEFLKDIIFAKYDKSNLTFQELYDNFGVNLICTGTIVQTGQILLFGKDFVNYNVIDAIMMSSSIPIFFEPPEFKDVHTNKVYQIVDGAVLMNMPILPLLNQLGEDTEITVLSMGSLDQNFRFNGYLTSIIRLLKFLSIGNQSMSVAWANKVFKNNLKIYYARCEDTGLLDIEKIPILLRQGIDAWNKGPVNPDEIDNLFDFQKEMNGYVKMSLKKGMLNALFKR